MANTPLSNLCALPTGITGLRVFANAVMVLTLLQHRPQTSHPHRLHQRQTPAGIEKSAGV